jgi:RNA polymerase sigma factor (sigma-70 family)
MTHNLYMIENTFIFCIPEYSLALYLYNIPKLVIAFRLELFYKVVYLKTLLNIEDKNMTEPLSVKTDYKKYSDAYADFYPYIFNAVYSKINHYEDSEDICQDIFFRMYNKFSEISQIRKWLNGTMRNVLFEYYRSKNVSTEDIEKYLDDSSMSYVNGFKEVRLIIEEAFNDSNIFDDDKDRIVFELMAVYNYSIINVSKAMGISYMQTRYKYRKTAEKLYAYLKERGIKDLEDLL